MLRTYTAIGVLAIIAIGAYASMARVASNAPAFADTGDDHPCGDLVAIETQWEGRACVELKDAAFYNAGFPCSEDEALIHTGAPEANPSPDGIACVHLDIISNNVIVDAVNQCAAYGQIVVSASGESGRPVCDRSLSVTRGVAWVLPDDGAECYVTRRIAACYPAGSMGAFPIGMR